MCGDNTADIGATTYASYDCWKNEYARRRYDEERFGRPKDEEVRIGEEKTSVVYWFY